MAKSMRSKWKRKCRAVKRERYGKKELDRLKKTLGIEGTSDEKDTQAMEDSVIITFTTADKIKEKRQEKNTDDMVTDVDMMDIKKKFNTKTLRNENGAYPVWLHPRKTKTKSKSSKKKDKVRKNKKKQN